ncbi:MAG: hypothetical protein PHI98_11880 [Eubacteriales bacterium]|nr:hypothetical protein [Eubacteriales bacterium]
MNLLEKRYSVLVGNYGSGKTELSIALARKLRKEKTGRIALVDLDIVNPYFRSGEQAELLRAEGIEVLMPTFAMSTVDIPALPAQIQGAFEQDFAHVVMDVGGDDTGAAALGRYAPYIKAVRQDMQVLYVVNPLRPFSDSEEDILALFTLISEKARLHPDLLINNANLQELTTADELIQGQELLTSVSRKLNLPVGAVTGEEKLYAQLPPEMQALFFPITPIMKPEWLTEQ